MKYIILTSDEGKKFSADKIADKRESAKNKILESGLKYIESTAVIGSFNYNKARIEEHCYIIESVGEDLILL